MVALAEDDSCNDEEEGEEEVAEDDSCNDEEEGEEEVEKVQDPEVTIPVCPECGGAAHAYVLWQLGVCVACAEGAMAPPGATDEATEAPAAVPETAMAPPGAEGEATRAPAAAPETTMVPPVAKRLLHPPKVQSPES